MPISLAPNTTRDWGLIRRQLRHVLHDQFAPVDVRRMLALLRDEGAAVPPGATVDTLLAMASDGPDLERLMRVARTVYQERTRGHWHAHANRRKDAPLGSAPTPGLRAGSA